jgi:glycosyltransferase 2 family protein
VVWIAPGLAFALFVHSVVELPGAALPVLVGANALAMVTGMLVFVVPAGLGAREAVLALLLSPWAPMGAAALIAVASRLWTIATELFGTAVMVALPGAREEPPPGS